MPKKANRKGKAMANNGSRVPYFANAVGLRTARTGGSNINYAYEDEEYHPYSSQGVSRHYRDEEYGHHAHEQSITSSQRQGLPSPWGSFGHDAITTNGKRVSTGIRRSTYEFKSAPAGAADVAMVDQPPPPGSNDTASTADSVEAGAAQAHQRSYQACIPCRQRKVRCDLGPVDDPHEPPCARCRREAKECYFSATRRKNKTNNGEQQPPRAVPDGQYFTPEHGHKRAGSESLNIPLTPFNNATSPPSFESPASAITPPVNQEAPLTPGGSIGRSRPLRRPSQPSAKKPTFDFVADKQPMSNETTAILQTKPVFHTRDALNLLCDAASSNGDLKPLPGHNFNAPRTAPQDSQDNQRPSKRQKANGIDPPYNFVTERANPEAIRHWSKMRFVKAGWFTAQEGIGYIDYFYRYLAPLTPITVPNFQDPGTHATLLREEPMLAVTMLVHASRFMPLSGPGGASRAAYVHERLWKFLQKMISRMIWSQEQFGGGFCGAGDRSQPGSGSFSGLRDLGAIESLLLLTEWHPRAMHFPPGDNNEDVLLLEDSEASNNELHGTAGSAHTNDGRPAKIEKFLEPCWRSDKLCWSLLGLALAFAYEMGIMSNLDSVDDPAIRGNDPNKKRMENVRRLLYIYITQTSGRLAFPSMMRPEMSQKLLSAEATAMAEGLAPMRHGDTRLVSTPVQDVVLYFWARLAELFTAANTTLFDTSTQTSEVILSDNYGAILDSQATEHKRWLADFERCKSIPVLMRHILTIEYEYMRVYSNTVALQAVVWRCKNNSPHSKSGVVPPHVLMRWLESDRKYVQEIFQCSQALLRRVIDGLLPRGHLKYAPVRLYHRITAVSMILLKTLAFGAIKEDFATSLGLLDRAADAMRTCIVDDVHVGSRMAEMLATTTSRLRSRIFRVSANNDKSDGPSRGQSHSPDNEESNQFRNQHNRLSNDQSSGTNHAGVTTVHTPWPGPPGSNFGPFPFPPQANLYGNQASNQGHTSGGNVNHPASANYQASPYAVDPLHGVLASEFDVNNPPVSIMPPPSFGAGGGYGSGSGESTFASSGFTPQNAHYSSTAGPNGGIYTSPTTAPQNALDLTANMDSDWLALPLDNLLAGGPTDVTHSGFGPDIGGADLLDILLTPSIEHATTPHVSTMGWQQPHSATYSPHGSM